MRKRRRRRKKGTRGMRPCPFAAKQHASTAAKQHQPCREFLPYTLAASSSATATCRRWSTWRSTAAWTATSRASFLRYDRVANPATAGRAPLPERPPPRAGTERFLEHEHLAFDPAVSSDYEVFLVPGVPLRRLHHALRSEWPPSPFTLRVWEERRHVREATGTVAHMQFCR
ncbi:hypothetical protein SETIT_9G168600v2 [Setaria italica]|uniref:Uncharacterized protein n=1 Tax=Setaria italica TaxID=4555 RepID=A0A368SHF7_SETIT|nr:hypothetical protein SETIT_9G168600v2 [Setaria italica]